MYEKYKSWIASHRGWVDLLERLRTHPRGFSFTVAAPQPDGDVTAYGTLALDNHLRVTREREAREELDEDGEYRADWKKYLAGFPDYLAMGAAFHDDMTDPRVDLRDKRDMMIASEADGHIAHNAAVLWLEDTGEVEAGHPGRVSIEPIDLSQQAPKPPSALGPDDRLDYEEVLKQIWASALIAAHPAWQNRVEDDRAKALLTYCIGYHDLSFVPRWNEPHLPDIRKRCHVTLGKMMKRRKTQFHDDDRIRVHPGFWGLYLFSPMHNLDRGFYEAVDADNMWIGCLSGALGMSESLTRHPSIEKTSQFQIYERVPRMWENTVITPPGVYFHRSRAHGRDDFLVLVTGDDAQSRKCMVICTKGVGADPGLIPEGTAGNLAHTGRLKLSWGNTGTSTFPFAYPDPGEADKAGSWRNVGFCLMQGSGHDEISSTDFDNFGAMYDEASQHPLKALATGFVEPFVAMEISCVPRNVARMPSVANGVLSQKKIGWPVEVATLGPLETSLRLYKRGEGQDYDYGHLPLEVVEWKRCYKDVALPPLLEAAILQDVQAFATGSLPAVLREPVEQEVKNEYAQSHQVELQRAVDEDVDRVLLSEQGAITNEVDTAARSTNKYSKYQKYLVSEGSDQGARDRLRREITEDHRQKARQRSTAAGVRLEQIIQQDRQHYEEQIAQRLQPRLDEAAPAIESLRDRMLLAGRMLHGMLASYVVFLDHGWATDTYTGSFSGRNYNSGPRDSNEWGDICEPSEDPLGGKSSGEGLLRGHVDLGNLGTAIGPGGDVYLSLGLATKALPNGFNIGAPEDSLLVAEAKMMWRGCAVQKCAAALSPLFAQGKTQLNELFKNEKSAKALAAGLKAALAGLAQSPDLYGLGHVFE